jgi:hypothetical protein
MEIFVYSIILLILLLSYFYAKRRNVKSEFVQCVEAGPIDGVDAAELKRRSYKDRQVVLRDYNGQELSHDKFVRLIIKGNCMEPRNIKDGDMVIAEKVEETRIDAIRQVLQTNNIVWLHIEDTGMDKIRIFKEWAGDEMVTCYYRNGVERESSSHHKIDQIRGIVRYKM